MKTGINIVALLVLFLSSSAVFAQAPQPAAPELNPVAEKMPATLGEPRFQERRGVLASVPEVSMRESDRVEARNFLTELIPGIAEVLAELETENPRAYERELRRARREMLSLKRQMKRDKNQYENSRARIKLEHESQMIVFRYRKAEDSQKESLKRELRATLDKLFDMREQEREQQVQRLEKKLEELRASLKTRKQNKNRIIEKRLEKLLGVDTDLQW